CRARTVRGSYGHGRRTGTTSGEWRARRSEIRFRDTGLIFSVDARPAIGIMGTIAGCPAPHAPGEIGAEERKMTKTRLTGYDAIDYAEEHDMLLGKYADPVEGARENLSPDEARTIAAKDPSLVYLDIQPSVLTAEIDDDAICVRD